MCRIYDLTSPFTKSLIYLLSLNFTSMAINHPYSLPKSSNERFLICQGMIHKDGKSLEIIEKLKKIYQQLRAMHLDKSGDLDNFLDEEILKKNNVDLEAKEKFERFYKTMFREEISKRTEYYNNMNKGNGFIRAVNRYKEVSKEPEEIDLDVDFVVKLNKGINKHNCLKLWELEELNSSHILEKAKAASKFFLHYSHLKLFLL